MVALAVLTAAAAGVAAAAGTTDVMLSPENDAVELGASVTYDVVGEAAGGVGSFEATVSTNDSSVASVRAVDYADDPAHANEPTGTDEVNLSATGMDTLDDGPVDIATVTVRTERDGVARLSLSVAALGDEQGRSYDVADTQGRTLTVGSGSTPTEGGGADGGDESDSGDGDDGDDGSGSDGSGSDDGASPTASPTPSATPTPTASPTATDTHTPTATTAANETSTGGGAPSPTETATPSQSESGIPTLAVVAGIVALLAVAGAVYWSVRG